ncbi:MAG: DUF6807 domain-containing protein [Flavisolibacter sp.]
MNRNYIKYLLTCTLLLLFLHQPNAQHLAWFEVKLKNQQQGIVTPVQVNLDAITFLPDSVLQLVEIQGKNRIPVSSQIQHSNQRILHWLIPEKNNKEKIRTFELIKSSPVAITSTMKIIDDNGFLTISNNNRNLVRYNYKTIYPPMGIDTVYRRSGFIHPLWSPRGQELTRINAPDHYHHWGLWNPWTEVLFENDTVDFWNLAKKEATVRFSNFISKTSGPVYAEYQALHEHVVFKKDQEKVAMNELQTVRIYNNAKDQNYYIADITIQLNCASESPVLLLEYRYGGLGIRATSEWDKKNSEIITSEGKTRKESDGSRARWVMAQGAVNNDHAGLVMMSYPTNYNFPEPLRVWPENMNNRGDVFLNFSPTKNMNWLIKPGTNYLLKYRFIVFNDTLSKEKAEAGWKDFAEPPIINIK